MTKRNLSIYKNFLLVGTFLGIPLTALVVIFSLTFPGNDSDQGEIMEIIAVFTAIVIAFSLLWAYYFHKRKQLLHR